MRSKLAKIILGIFTIGSFVTLLTATFVLPEFINAQNKNTLFEVREWLVDANMLILCILFVFYFFYSLLSSAIPKDKKYLWAALLFFGNIFVMPFFWYLYVWKQENEISGNKNTT